MQDRVKQVMANIFNLHIDEVEDNASVETLELWDSLKHINLVLAIEEEFKVRFDESEIPELTSLEAILTVLKEKVETAC